MFILTTANDDNEGAYAVANEYGDNVLIIFEEEDDATRYLGMLEDLGYDELEVTEVDPEVAIMACDHLDYQYAIITPNDIVVPPDYVKIPKNKI
jgi:hypothetical protein